MNRLGGIILLSGITAGTGGLGVWQYRRMKWKENLIADRTRQLRMTPVPLAEAEDEWTAVEKDANKSSSSSSSSSPFRQFWRYKPVRIRGVFDYTHEVLVGPKPPPKGDIAEKMARRHEPRGFYVYTPLTIVDDKAIESERMRMRRGDEDRSDMSENEEISSSLLDRKGEGKERRRKNVLLVNRGWIPKSAAAVRSALLTDNHSSSSSSASSASSSASVHSTKGSEEGGEGMIEEVTGIVDFGLKEKPSFVPDTSAEQASTLRQYFWLDVPRIERETGIVTPTLLSSSPTPTHSSSSSPDDSDDGMGGEERIFLVAMRPTGRRIGGLGLNSPSSSCSPSSSSSSSSRLRSTTTTTGDSPLSTSDRVRNSPTSSQWPVVKSSDDFLEFYVSPFKHKIYAGTWFSLAGFGTVMTLLRFRK